MICCFFPSFLSYNGIWIEKYGNKYRLKIVCSKKGILLVEHPLKSHKIRRVYETMICGQVYKTILDLETEVKTHK